MTILCVPRSECKLPDAEASSVVCLCTLFHYLTQSVYSCLNKWLYGWTDGIGYLKDSFCSNWKSSENYWEKPEHLSYMVCLEGAAEIKRNWELWRWFMGFRPEFRSSAPMSNTRHGDGPLNPSVRGAEIGRSPGPVASWLHQNSERQVQWEILSQKIRERMIEEDTWLGSLASTNTHTGDAPHMELCVHAHRHRLT